MVGKNRKIGLALSGGGYRAAAYHIGTLRALNRLGILDKIDVISSVSGGSITAAYYALNKDDYPLFEKNFIDALHTGVIRPVYGLAYLWGAILLAVSIGLGILCGGIRGILLCVFVLIGLFYFFVQFSFIFMPSSKLITRGYDKLFFKGKTLGNLPLHPKLAINSTNIATQKPFCFSGDVMGEYAYTLKNKSIFQPKDFPVSKAVMASSCVPYGFTPIKVDKKYLVHAYDECTSKPEPPMLIDGGIYDNQGAHKLSQENSKYYTDLIIVSDAGNTEVRAKGTTGIKSLAIKTIDMMMDRIKKMQRLENLYHNHASKSHYAYAPLEWNCGECLIDGFVRNLILDNVHEDVWRLHGITENDINNLKSAIGSTEQKRQKLNIAMKVKKSIQWEKLIKKRPLEEDELKARSVKTNLKGLKDDQIICLIKHAEWMTEAQVRLYLPFLV